MELNIALDTVKTSPIPVEIGCLRRGEKANVQIKAAITQKGSPYAIGEREVWLYAELPSGMVALAQADMEGDSVSVEFPAGGTSETGVVKAYFAIKEGDEFLDTTQAFSFRVLDDIDMDAGEVEAYIPFIDNLVELGEVLEGGEEGDVLVRTADGYGWSDQQAIVEAVLDALPAAEEASF